jgi:hypothetical protein
MPAARFLFALVSAAVQDAVPPPAPAQPPPQAPERGLLRKTEAASPGFTLFAPLRSCSTYLIDADGATVHEWRSDAPPGQSVYLLPNGNLLRCERVDNDTFFGGGQGGRVRELDWDGKVVWEYVCSDDTRLQHHDVEPLPDGNVLVIAWERKSGAEAIAAGRDPRLLLADEIWPDMVLEIEPVRPSGGKVVWEWHAWDHLVQDRHPDLPHHGEIAANPGRIDVNASGVPPARTEEDREELEKLRELGYAGDAPPRGPGTSGPPDGGADWLHCNSIDSSPELDLIVLSSRELSEIWFIDHSTTTDEAKGSTGGRWGKGGDLLFRWGNPRRHRGAGDRTLFGQHDVHWIPAGLPGAGNLLLFNNGERGVREWSSADELRIALTHDALKNPFAAEGGVKVELVASFRSPDFCGHVSGAQRLANGNTLVCAGETGRGIEFTPAGEVAWEYLNPHGGDAPPPRPPKPRSVRMPGRFRPPGGPPPGPGGPEDPRALFRATRIAPDHPGLARLAR